MSNVEAGWHQDPRQPGQLRWWDGQTWTEHTQPAKAEVVPQTSPLLTQPSQSITVNGRGDVAAFHFDGGAGTFLGTAILAFLVTVVTLGICYPFALVLFERWKAKHTYVEGRRLVFTGTGLGLFGNWLKWLFLIVVTLGIYSFWVIPRLTKWRTEHLAFDPAHR